MAIQNAEDLFLAILSHLHASEQRLLQVTEEMRQAAQEEKVKDMLDVRAHLTRQEISNIEECFRLLGKQPTKPTTRLLEVFAEDFRRELNEIQTPALKALYILDAIRRIQNLHIAEYATLVTMAYLADNLPVATLLERNLEDKVQFVERTRDLLKEIGKTVITAKMMRKAA